MALVFRPKLKVGSVGTYIDVFFQCNDDVADYEDFIKHSKRILKSGIVGHDTFIMEDIK